MIISQSEPRRAIAKGNAGAQHVRPTVAGIDRSGAEDDYSCGVTRSRCAPPSAPAIIKIDPFFFHLPETEGGRSAKSALIAH
ncbi:hypothetical protein CDAR_390321 [Caerostris darwini]|uniref:Uncharacterized protein n=1 Tax=Caerostris darwini TaxID=1538125 RepID=A0AAV4NXX9_9ARAC|nr:hypothetical protein CDAR_390321 [Caerostris darwini]